MIPIWVPILIAVVFFTAYALADYQEYKRKYKQNNDSD